MPYDPNEQYQYDPTTGTPNSGTTGYGTTTTPGASIPLESINPNVAGVTPWSEQQPVYTPANNRQAVADAYRRYLGRDLTDNEYGFWAGNSNFEDGIRNSPEAQQYARTGQGGNYWNPGAAPEGFDAAKWRNQSVQTPKYIAGRLLAAGASIQQAAQAIGATVIDATRMRLPSGEIIDTRRDEEGANALQWLVLGQGANAGNNYTTPGTGGAGGAGGTGTSGHGTAFSDPATAEWEALLRQMVDRLNTPVPAATTELRDTQALDPLERQRQQQKQQESLRLSQRGIRPGDGIYDDAMRRIDEQFNQLRTRTQAGFANSDAQNAEQRQMQAVNLFAQIPQYQDARLRLAQGTMMDVNPFNALNLMQQYQSMAQQNSQYNNAQQQQLFMGLSQLIDEWLNRGRN